MTTFNINLIYPIVFGLIYFYAIDFYHDKAIKRSKLSAHEVYDPQIEVEGLTIQQIKTHRHNAQPIADNRALREWFHNENIQF
jgi:hypothetical protein